MLKRILLCMMISVGGAAQAAAEGSVGPGTVFVAPQATDQGGNDGDEVSTDLGFFLDIGYRAPDYDVYYDLRMDAARDVIIPDYVARTGKLPPDEVLVEIAPVFLTGGDYNDMLVYSHLPGDCGPGGCLAQIYRTDDGRNWRKVLEFTSLAFAYKQADGDSPSEVVAVGNESFPNVIYEWNGTSFGRTKP